MAQLAQHAAAHPSTHSLELRLSPAELGPVQMTFKDGGAGQITVAIHAGRPDTLELLRSNIHILAQEFHHMGFAAASFSFGQGSQGAASQPMPDPGPPAAPPVADAAAPASRPALAAASGAAAAAAGGLDLRL
jgi:hypothetical protein